MDKQKTYIKNFWLSEIAAVEGEWLPVSNFGPKSRTVMLLYALEYNKTVFIDKFLDYQGIPKDLTLKQRLVIYQLSGV